MKMRIPVILIVLLSLTFALPACKIFSKNKSIHRTTADSVVKKDSLADVVVTKKDSIVIKVGEEIKTVQEDKFDKQTVIEEFAPDGTLTKRTTTLEKTERKKTEQTQKQTTDTQIQVSDSTAKTATTGTRQVKTSTVEKSATTSRSTFLTGIATTTLLILLLLYLLYRYIRSRLPKNFYPF